MFWKYDDEEEKVVLKKVSEEARLRYFPPDPRVENEKLAELAAQPIAETEEEFGSSDETGSEERFETRVAVFEKEDKPIYKHHFWWFVHNCIAHPAIGIAPCRKTFDFHDWTSKKINGK